MLLNNVDTKEQTLRLEEELYTVSMFNLETIDFYDYVEIVGSGCLYSDGEILVGKENQKAETPMNKGF